MSIQTSFTDWNGNESLQHHGIRGMKWGVRRYQNVDGSLTAAGEARYGARSMGSVGARRMARDFNRLDAGYANVEARRSSYAETSGRYARKAKKYHAKVDADMQKGRDPVKNIAKMMKANAKATKYGQKAANENQIKKNIENLQWKILAKAAAQGYTVNSKPVVRYGQDGKTMAAQMLGGVIGNMTYSAMKRRRNFAKVYGQNISVSRRGDGSTNVVTYNNMNDRNRKNNSREARKKLDSEFTPLNKRRG